MRANTRLQTVCPAEPLRAMVDMLDREEDAIDVAMVRYQMLSPKLDCSQSDPKRNLDSGSDDEAWISCTPVYVGLAFDNLAGESSAIAML